MSRVALRERLAGRSMATRSLMLPGQSAFFVMIAAGMVLAIVFLAAVPSLPSSAGLELAMGVAAAGGLAIGWIVMRLWPRWAIARLADHPIAFRAESAIDALDVHRADGGLALEVALSRPFEGDLEPRLVRRCRRITSHGSRLELVSGSLRDASGSIIPRSNQILARWLFDVLDALARLPRGVVLAANVRYVQDASTPGLSWALADIPADPVDHVASVDPSADAPGVASWPTPERFAVRDLERWLRTRHVAARSIAPRAAMVAFATGAAVVVGALLFRARFELRCLPPPPTWGYLVIAAIFAPSAWWAFRLLARRAELARLLRLPFSFDPESYLQALSTRATAGALVVEVDLRGDGRPTVTLPSPDDRMLLSRDGRGIVIVSAELQTSESWLTRPRSNNRALHHWFRTLADGELARIADSISRVRVSFAADREAELARHRADAYR